ncbi:hypothetical protein [Massilia timonae]|uniref:hypothetical protein n=1 Tax=Massilia timonae TaxID=47229 RepID=UPI0028D27F67|nr:hypothetical protein [Massilia timonae]
MLAVFGTWVAALGSISAAVVALYLANRSGAQRLKSTVTVVIRFTSASTLFQPGERVDTLLRFEVLNLGDRPVQITQLGWQAGLWTKSHCMQMVPPMMHNYSLPVDLEYGQSAHWLFLLEDSEDSWGRYFNRTFLRDAGPLKSLTLMAVFQTSLENNFL